LRGDKYQAGPRVKSQTVDNLHASTYARAIDKRIICAILIMLATVSVRIDADSG